MTDLVSQLVGALDGQISRHKSALMLLRCDDEFIANQVADAEAALTAAKAGGWQSMESAPLDGTEVLCWREDCGQFIASYTSMDAMPLTQDEIDAADEDTLFAKDWFTQWPQSFRLEGSELPTAWQPLPTPPKEQA